MGNVLLGVPAPQLEGAEIFRATASDPGGPWQGDPEPVVPVGESGDVDGLGVDFPSVVPTEDGYLMLYGANGGTGRMRRESSPPPQATASPGRSTAE